MEKCLHSQIENIGNRPEKKFFDSFQISKTWNLTRLSIWTHCTFRSMRFQNWTGIPTETVLDATHVGVVQGFHQVDFDGYNCKRSKLNLWNVLLELGADNRWGHWVVGWTHCFFESLLKYKVFICGTAQMFCLVLQRISGLWACLRASPSSLWPGRKKTPCEWYATVAHFPASRRYTQLEF